MNYPDGKIKRSDFLQKSMIGAAGLLLPVSLLGRNPKQEKPAPIKLEIVKEYVMVAHGKFDRLKEMLENDHLLLHVSHDWGGGDYESAIEAAGHVGNKEIASYLLGKGARYNIYLACMLGNLEIVKQVLTTNPQLLNSKGPHGLRCFTMRRKEGKNQKGLLITWFPSGQKKRK